MVEEKNTKVEKEVKKVEDVKETSEKTEEKKVETKVEEKKEVEKVETKKTESKPAKDKKEDKKENKVELEREYIVPMRKGFMNVPHYRRAKKAVKTLKEFMVKHMNIRDGDTRKVKVNIHLNNEIWFRGIRNPLHKIKVIAKKIDGIVYVEMKDIPEVIKFKIAREAKAAAAAMAGEKGVQKVEKKVEADANKDGVDDKKEEAEDKKAGTEKKEKAAKVETKKVKHTIQGKHAQKTAPVRKVLK
jgi:ribosomal protein L31E